MERASGCVLGIHLGGPSLSQIKYSTVAAHGKDEDYRGKRTVCRVTYLHTTDHILQVFLPSSHDQQLPTKFDVDLHPFNRQDSCSF